MAVDPTSFDTSRLVECIEKKFVGYHPGVSIVLTWGSSRVYRSPEMRRENFSQGYRSRCGTENRATGPPGTIWPDISKRNNIALDLFLIAQEITEREKNLRSLRAHLSPIFNLWRSFISCRCWKSLYWIPPRLFAGNGGTAISLPLPPSIFLTLCSWHNNGVAKLEARVIFT